MSKHRITIAVDHDNLTAKAFIPKAIADLIEIDWLEVDDPTPDSYYKSHGDEHPAITAERLSESNDHITHRIT